jgi:hypothetical protein
VYDVWKELPDELPQCTEAEVAVDAASTTHGELQAAEPLDISLSHGAQGARTRTATSLSVCRSATDPAFRTILCAWLCRSTPAKCRGGEHRRVAAGPTLCRHKGYVAQRLGFISHTHTHTRTHNFVCLMWRWRTCAARLEEASLAMADVCFVCVYLRDMSLFVRCNGVYRRHFGANPPSRYEQTHSGHCLL